MKKLKKLWIPVLLGLLLMAILVGVASAGPKGKAAPQRAWRVITVPFGSCIPADAAYNWSITGDYLRCPSGQCVFSCPLNFPAAGEQAAGAVTVKRLTGYAFDNESGLGRYVWFWIQKTNPSNKTTNTMTLGAGTVDSSADPQAVVVTTFNYNPVLRIQGPVLGIQMFGGTLRFYGARIHYTW